MVSNVWKIGKTNGVLKGAVLFVVLATILAAGGCSLLPNKKNATAKSPVRPSSVSSMDDFMMLERP